MYLSILGVGSISLVGPTGAYAVTLLGQTFAAMANALFMNIPASLASTWFSMEERDIATAVASMCNPVGDVIGQIMPTLLVKKRNGENDDGDGVIIDGMFTLMVVQFGWSIIGLLIGYFFLDAKPSTPPSASTLFKEHVGGCISSGTSDHETMNAVLDVNVKTIVDKRTDENNKNNENPVYSDHGNTGIIGIIGINGISNSSSSSSSRGSSRLHASVDGKESAEARLISREKTYDLSYQRSKQEIILLFSNRDYVVLFISISMFLGIFNSVLGLLNQMIENYGYSNDDAGLFGAMIVSSGIFFSVGVGYVMDRTHAYKTLLQCCLLFASLACIFFLTMIYTDNYNLLSFAAVLLGITVVPLVPIATETCAEITYPISEDMSVGMLQVGGNYVGIIVTFVVQELLNKDPLGPPPFIPSSLFIMATLLISLGCISVFKGEYKRLRADQHIYS